MIYYVGRYSELGAGSLEHGNAFSLPFWDTIYSIEYSAGCEGEVEKKEGRSTG
jgi:hypothetical protein